MDHVRATSLCFQVSIILMQSMSISQDVDKRIMYCNFDIVYYSVCCFFVIIDLATSHMGVIPYALQGIPTFDTLICQLLCLASWFAFTTRSTRNTPPVIDLLVLFYCSARTRPTHTGSRLDVRFTRTETFPDLLYCCTATVFGMALFAIY